MGEMIEAVTTTAPQTTPSRALPSREDCWSEEATSTLVDVWGRRYSELNRGNLRQKDWQEVADAVNALHGHTKKTRRTDVQCKNRIDTLKKKYKTEKAKIVESNGTLTSAWPFFSRLDPLIGSNYNKSQKLSPVGFNSPPTLPSPSVNSPPMAVPLPFPYGKLALPPPPMATIQPSPQSQIQSQPIVLPQKRPAAVMDDSYFRRNYSTMAAAAAKPVVDEEESEEEEEEDEEGLEENVELEGMRKLAKAIEGFGKIYERVERMKQRQMVELEKQRMQFTKDLEVQRMQLFMDTQVQLEKIKQGKRSGSDGIEFDISEIFQQYNQFICNFL